MPAIYPPESTCPAAWHGGLHCLPIEWRHYPAIAAVDRAGLHALLRSYGLPYAELRYMAGPYASVLNDRGALAYVEAADLLLGRIAWDRHYGDKLGIGFHADALPTARAMGAAVRGTWFRA